MSSSQMIVFVPGVVSPNTCRWTLPASSKVTSASLPAAPRSESWYSPADEMRASTRRAYLELAALVADGFGNRPPMDT
jgi:hypothetical protein